MDHQRKILGGFLKARRSNLSPKLVGLPEGHTRRRALGLRREEVAQLADVSLTWYTWLEQGREISASDEVLNRLAEALRLTLEERQYMYGLAGKSSPPVNHQSEYILSPAFLNLVNSTPHPYLVVGPHNRLIAWNAMACEIYTDFSALPSKDLQMMRLIFLHPAFRSKVVNWESASKMVLAYYRKLYDQSADQQWYADLIKGLTEQSKEFREMWQLHEVGDKNGMQVEIEHASMGRLHFEVLTFAHDHMNVTSCIYVPRSDTETAYKLAAWQNSIATKARI